MVYIYIYINIQSILNVPKVFVLCFFFHPVLFLRLTSSLKTSQENSKKNNNQFPFTSSSPFLCLHIPPTPCTEWMCRFIMRLLCVCVLCGRLFFRRFLCERVCERHKDTHTHTHPVKFVDPLFTLYIEKTNSRRPDLFLEHEERKTKRKPVCAHLFSHYVSKNNKRPASFFACGFRNVFSLIFYFYFLVSWRIGQSQVFLCVPKFRIFLFSSPFIISRLFFLWHIDDTHTTTPDWLLSISLNG